MKINSNLCNISLAVLLGCVLFPLLTVKADSEVCVDPFVPVAEIFKAAENAISRLEKRPADDLAQFLRSETRKALAWQEIADLDEQLLNFILLRQNHGVEALELKWRQYSAGCRERFPKTSRGFQPVRRASFRARRLSAGVWRTAAVRRLPRFSNRRRARAEVRTF